MRKAAFLYAALWLCVAVLGGCYAATGYKQQCNRAGIDTVTVNGVKYPRVTFDCERDRIVKGLSK